MAVLGDWQAQNETLGIEESALTWMIFLTLTPVLRMQTGQLPDAIHDFLNRIGGNLGGKGTAFLGQVVHDGDALLVTRAAPPALGEDHVVHRRRQLSKEFGLALRQADCPRLLLYHLGVEDALDADMRRPLIAAFMFVRDGVKQLAARAPNASRILNRLDLVAEFGSQPFRSQILRNGWKLLTSGFRHLFLPFFSLLFQLYPSLLSWHAKGHGMNNVGMTGILNEQLQTLPI